MITVLFSGGLDSTTLAQLARAKGKLHSILFVSYGQAADSAERNTAIVYSARYDIPLEIRQLPLSGLEAMNGTGSGARVVPGRNLILLGVAANYAVSKGVETVWFGATAADYQYPDCSPYFLEGIAKVISQDTGIIIEAPLIHNTKKEVLKLSRSVGVDLGCIWYCYEPTANNQPCGECGSCLDHPE